MLRRLSWFAAGVAAGLGGTTWLATRMSRARRSLTPADLGRSAALSVAEVLASTGARLRNRPS